MAKREEEIANLELELRGYSFTETEICEMVVADEQVRGYYPELAKLLKNRDAATFLSQVKFWWNTKKRAPFYKYNKPCDGSAYGDSWVEELAMSYAELQTIKSLVCTRVRSHAQALDLSTNGTTLNTLVVCYKNSSGVTFWYFNERLFCRLRALALAKYPNKEQVEAGPKSGKSTMAIVKNPEYGHSHPSQLSLYTEQQQIDLHEEKEINKEKENEEEDFGAPVVITRPIASDAKREATKVKVSKGRKPQTPQQAKIIEINNRGTTMPLDFQVKPSTIDECVALGYEREDLDTLTTTFVDYYTNTDKGRKWKALNWDFTFRDNYLTFKYDNGVIKRNGRYKDGKEDANTSRATKLRELATGSVFDRVGTTSLSELGERLRGRGN